MHQRIARLQRGDGSDGLCAIHLLDIEIGNSNPAHLSFTLQLRHRVPAFLKLFRVLDRPVDLVKVDSLNLKPAQTILAFPSDRGRCQGAMSLPLPIPAKAAFGKYVRPGPVPSLESVCHDFL